jgi:hypothetical protein
MANIYFDSKKELLVWGIVWVILGNIVSMLFDYDSDYGAVGVIGIFLWTGLGKYGSKFIIERFFSGNFKIKFDLKTKIMVLRYRLSNYYKKKNSK